MFDQNNNCLVVVGAQWGDEGKGKLVDVLAEQANCVVRYQGGANAGHTVVVGDRQFILHQIPSGILHPAVRCVIGNGVVLDPVTLVSELEEVTAQGVDVRGRLFLSDRAHVVLPLHKRLDRAIEAQQRIGTTGRGIGPAYEAKVGRRGLRMAELCRADGAEAIVTEAVRWANALLGQMGEPQDIDVAEHLALLAEARAHLGPLTCDTGLLVYQALQRGERVLLEGAQGAMLDIDHGTYPYVTSSNTTAGGAAVGAGIGPTRINGALGVVKAYTTRVGNGPLPSEAPGEVGEQLRQLGGEWGATTGRARRCGWFDAVVVRYSVRVNGLTDLAVTKLDVLDTFAEIPIVVGYELDGTVCPEMPADAAALERVRPVVEIMPGWQQPTTAATRWDDLPAAARHYLERLEALAGCPIRYVSVGTRRDQILERPRD